MDEIGQKFIVFDFQDASLIGKNADSGRFWIEDVGYLGLPDGASNI
jgi:hypothetical protein